MSRLQRRWRAVREDFFPRWTAGRGWRCTARTTRTVDGYCDIENRTVIVRNAPDDDDGLDALLVHEIAHAVASPGHGRVWARRMHRAADTARELGRVGLADKITEEVASYDRPTIDRAAVLAMVENAVSMNRDMTFGQVTAMVAAECGMLASEVEAKCRSLRRVYDEARRPPPASV